MASYNKDHYDAMCDLRRYAFQNIAKALGKEHEITKLMGPLAWGRNDFEPKPDRKVADAHAEFGYLEGCFHILNIWARDNDVVAQMVMLKHWPRGYHVPTRG